MPEVTAHLTAALADRACGLRMGAKDLDYSGLRTDCVATHKLIPM